MRGVVEGEIQRSMDGMRSSRVQGTRAQNMRSMVNRVSLHKVSDKNSVTTSDAYC
jgi:hypothetical protein